MERAILFSRFGFDPAADRGTAHIHIRLDSKIGGWVFRFTQAALVPLCMRLPVEAEWKKRGSPHPATKVRVRATDDLEVWPEVGGRLLFRQDSGVKCVDLMGAVIDTLAGGAPTFQPIWEKEVPSPTR